VLVSALDQALEEGIAGPARLRDLLAAELRRGEEELALPRSGYGAPVVVAFGAASEGVVAAVPVPVGVRADAAEVGDRAWLVVSAAVGALQQAADLPPPRVAGELRLRAGRLGDALAVLLGGGDAQLAQLAFDEAVAGVDRLRARAVSVPDGLLAPADLREPIGPAHPLRVAEALARMRADPADPDEATEEAVLALLQPPAAMARPHDDPDPPRRVARRILQRLDGMGKWGGYHTEFTHLARGFEGNDRALAGSVGEALLEAGLLAGKRSVGQRHVFLNPRRAGEIRRLIEHGTLPAGLRLPPK
jgi:hypothetical protein